VVGGALPSHWQEEFERLRCRIGDKKAIVAIACKLLVTVWHVLTKREMEAVKGRPGVNMWCPAIGVGGVRPGDGEGQIGGKLP